ncbi:MAG TPA: LpxD N-terminal domain-containing protein, partial [Chroococcales cyanobacterium]
MPKAMKGFSLNEIARAFDLKVRGSGDFLVRGVANPEKAEQEDLVFLVESNFLDKIEKTAALAYVGRPGDFIEGKHQILADNPRLAMAQILSLFVPSPPTGIHPTAVVEEGAEIGPG